MILKVSKPLQVLVFFHEFNVSDVMIHGYMLNLFPFYPMFLEI